MVEFCLLLGMVVNDLVHSVPRSLLPVNKLLADELLLAQFELSFSLLACLVDDVVPVIFSDCQ